MAVRSFDLSRTARAWHLAPPVKFVFLGEFRYTPEQSPFELQIALHTAGSPEEAQIDINGVEYRLPYPHLIIKRPGDKIRCAPGGGQSIYFKYDPAHAPEIPPDAVAGPLGLTPETGALTRRLARMLEDACSFGMADRIDAVCLELAAELLAGLGAASQCDRRIREAASYLGAHPLELSGPAELAAKFGFSRRNFDRRWQAEFGEAPGRSFRAARMAEARTLLLETDLSVLEIAGRLGFAEAANFTTAFRREFKITPLACRRRG